MIVQLIIDKEKNVYYMLVGPLAAAVTLPVAIARLFKCNDGIRREIVRVSTFGPICLENIISLAVWVWCLIGASWLTFDGVLLPQQSRKCKRGRRSSTLNG